jgi:hypothetical protein
MKYKALIRLAFCSLALALVLGCGEDFPLFTETLDIEDVDVRQSYIAVGGTTTIEASVFYSGDDTVLMYEWTADAGTIGGNGSTATYIAPGTPGTYSITLLVSDGAISDDRTVQIKVGQEAVDSLVLEVDAHWPATSHKDELKYKVNVESVTTGKVSLHYRITQDRDEFDAFLSIQIGQTTVLQETAIGAEQPSTAKTTVDEMDVSHIINSPGWYTITFYIRPGDRVANGWLMNEAKLTGVRGTADPQQ